MNIRLCILQIYHSFFAQQFKFNILGLNERLLILVMSGGKWCVFPQSKDELLGSGSMVVSLVVANARWGVVIHLQVIQLYI